MYDLVLPKRYYNHLEVVRKMMPLSRMKKKNHKLHLLRGTTGPLAVEAVCRRVHPLCVSNTAEIYTLAESKRNAGLLSFRKTETSCNKMEVSVSL